MLVAMMVEKRLKREVVVVGFRSVPMYKETHPSANSAQSSPELAFRCARRSDEEHMLAAERAQHQQPALRLALNEPTRELPHTGFDLHA